MATPRKPPSGLKPLATAEELYERDKNLVSRQFDMFIEDKLTAKDIHFRNKFFHVNYFPVQMINTLKNNPTPFYARKSIEMFSEFKNKEENAFDSIINHLTVDVLLLARDSDKKIVSDLLNWLVNNNKNTSCLTKTIGGNPITPLNKLLACNDDECFQQVIGSVFLSSMSNIVSRYISAREKDFSSECAEIALEVGGIGMYSLIRGLGRAIQGLDIGLARKILDILKNEHNVTFDTIDEYNKKTLYQEMNRQLAVHKSSNESYNILQELYREYRE